MFNKKNKSNIHTAAWLDSIQTIKILGFSIVVLIKLMDSQSMSANDVLRYVLVTSLASELSFHCCFACSRAFVTAVVSKFVCTQAFFYVSSSRKKKGSQEVGRGESTSPPLQLLSVIESSVTVYPKIQKHSLWKWK